jgi:hypothetical protein
MAAPPKPSQDHRWRIIRITGTPAKFVGYVDAPDKDTAIRKAVEQFQIERPWRNRLMAIRER